MLLRKSLQLLLEAAHLSDPQRDFVVAPSLAGEISRSLQDSQGVDVRAFWYTLL